MTDPSAPPPSPGRPSRSADAIDHYRFNPSRLLEDIAFAVGILSILARVVVELAHETGHWAPLADHKGIPWAFAASVVLLIAPKMLGKATAGRVWEALGGGVSAGLGKLVGRGRPAGPGED